MAVFAAQVLLQILDLVEEMDERAVDMPEILRDSCFQTLHEIKKGRDDILELGPVKPLLAVEIDSGGPLREFIGQRVEIIQNGIDNFSHPAAGLGKKLLQFFHLCRVDGTGRWFDSFCDDFVLELPQFHFDEVEGKGLLRIDHLFENFQFRHHLFVHGHHGSKGIDDLKETFSFFLMDPFRLKIFLLQSFKLCLQISAHTVTSR